MNWIYNSADPLLVTLASCLGVFISIIIATRLIGLRSFANFSAYDFVLTLAIGSIAASVLTTAITLTHGSVAIFGLMLLTYIFSILQRRSGFFDSLVSNKPLLLMDASEILYDNLKKARIQEKQLITKLREANVYNFDQVLAVVLETTGDITVLHKSSASKDLHLDEEILRDVSRK